MSEEPVFQGKPHISSLPVLIEQIMFLYPVYCFVNLLILFVYIILTVLQLLLEFLYFLYHVPSLSVYDPFILTLRCSQCVECSVSVEDLKLVRIQMKSK